MMRSIVRCASPLLALFCVALLAGCGASPEPAAPPASQPAAVDEDAPPPADPAPADEDAPPSLAEDGAKPGEHGCGSCAVRVCAAGSAISGLRVQLKLETSMSQVSYQKAILRLKTADGRGEAALLETGKLSPGANVTQSVSGGALKQIKAPDDMKGGSALLELHWSGPEGSGAKQFPLAVGVGSCP